MRRSTLLVLALVALVTTPAVADNKRDCLRSDDAAIMANTCGAAIALGSYQGLDLADLHQKRARGLIRQARPVDHNTDKRYADAIESLGEAIKAVLAAGGDRNRLREAYYWRAYVFVETKQFDRAVADLDEAIKARPTDASAFALRSEAHLAKGDADRSIADVDAAIRHDSKRFLAHSVLYERRALAHELRGAIDKAVADARRADGDAKTRGHPRMTDLVKRLEQKLAAGGAAPTTTTAAPVPASTPVAAEDQLQCRSANNHRASIESCTRAIRSGSFSGDALARLYAYRIYSYVMDKQYDRVIADTTEFLTKVLPHRPGTKVANEMQYDAFYYRGTAYNNTKQYAKAVADFNLAIEYRASANALYARGESYLAMKDLDRAIGDFNEAIRVNDKHVLAHSDRALAYEKKGDLQKAIADARRAVEIQKAQGSTPWFGLETIKRIEPKLAAGGAGPAAVSSAPAPAPTTGSPATTGDTEQCLKGSDATAALAACTRLISSGRPRGDELAQIQVMRANWYFSADQYDRAIADADEVINRILRQSSQAKVENTHLKNAYSVRGSAHFLKKDYARAIADLSVLIRDNLGNASTLSLRGRALFETGAFDRAIADYGELIRLNPNHADAYQYRALSLEKQGQIDQALADARRSAAIQKSSGVFESSTEIVKRLEQRLAGVGTSVATSTPAAARPLPPSPPVQQAAPVQPPAPAPVIAALPKPATPAAVPATPPEVRVALVIGNSKYRTATRLTNPANDATDVAAALRKLGFDVVEGRDLDKRALEDKVREFGRKLDRASLALFFYAGHGLQVGGKNYLVPIDAKLERPGDLTFEAIDVSQVLAQMEAEQRVNLVFLDACRDNPLARTLARSLGTRSASVGQGLATIQSAVGTMIAYATQPDNVALDGEGRNSPFTTALLKHIATPGLEISSLMKRVRGDVIQATRNKQVPWDHSSLVGDVVLAR